MTTTPQPYSSAAFSSTAAAGFMREALSQLNDVKNHFIKTKVAALKAGYFFYKARQSVGEGNFNTFIEGYKPSVSRPTIYRAIAFLDQVAAEVVKARPDLANKLDAIIAVAESMALQSPREFTELCRQLELMRKFGEYDQVKYAKNKLAADNGQIHFDFLDVCEALDVISQLGKTDLIWKLPEGKQTPDALRELKTKLDAAGKQVEEALKNAEAINT